MVNRIQLRAPSTADARSIAALSSELGYEVAPDSMADRVSALLGNRDHHIVVAEVDNEVAGWIQVHAFHFLESGFRAEIVGLVVGAKFRRIGIGRLLVNDAIRWSVSCGAEALVVRSNVVRKESHQFYPSVGFELAKTQAVYRKQLRDFP